MILNVSDALVHYISHVRNANEAWKTICSAFKRRHVVNRLHLRQELFGLKMTEGDSAQDHINKLQVFVDQLANISHRVSDEDQAFTLLGSLPPCIKLW